jgi:hypothetical protein
VNQHVKETICASCINQHFKENDFKRLVSLCLKSALSFAGAATAEGTAQVNDQLNEGMDYRVLAPARLALLDLGLVNHASCQIMHALPVGENDIMMLLLLYQYCHFTADAKDELVPVPEEDLLVRLKWRLFELMSQPKP